MTLKVAGEIAAAQTLREAADMLEAIIARPSIANKAVAVDSCGLMKLRLEDLRPIAGTAAFDAIKIFRMLASTSGGYYHAAKPYINNTYRRLRYEQQTTQSGGGI